VIQGNFIGTDASGTQKLGNGTFGITFQSGAVANMVGGSTSGARNVISGNGSTGVGFYIGATGNQILGNLIGTDYTGTQKLGNVSYGVYFNFSGGNTVG